MVDSLLQTTYKVAAFIEKDPGCQQELSYLHGPLTCPTDHLSSLISFRRRDPVTVTQITLATDCGNVPSLWSHQHRAETSHGAISSLPATKS